MDPLAQTARMEQRVVLVNLAILPRQVEMPTAARAVREGTALMGMYKVAHALPEQPEGMVKKVERRREATVETVELLEIVAILRAVEN